MVSGILFLSFCIVIFCNKCFVLGFKFFVVYVILVFLFNYGFIFWRVFVKVWFGIIIRMILFVFIVVFRLVFSFSDLGKVILGI